MRTRTGTRTMTDIVKPKTNRQQPVTHKYDLTRTPDPTDTEWEIDSKGGRDADLNLRTQNRKFERPNKIRL